MQLTPARVKLVPHEVPPAAWYEIELAFATSTLPGQIELLLELDVFLRGRSRFRGLLSEYRVKFTADSGVTKLLERGNTDNASLVETLRAPSAASAVDIKGELEHGGWQLMRALRDFQESDLSTLSALSHGANFSVPGSGKTTVTLALHALERSRARVDKLLVVAPLSAFEAWFEEAGEVLSPAPTVARYAGGAVPRSDVVLVNYHRLAPNVDTLSRWMSDKRVHLVIDEAHRAKRGLRGEWGRALSALAPLATRRDILTGTPAPNHPRDLVSLLDLLWPGGRASGLVPQTALIKDPSRAAMAQVHQSIEPLFVRTTKDRLGLRPAKIKLVPVSMGPLQQQIYDAMLRRYAGSLDLDRVDAARFGQLGEVTMYLMQAASSPRLLRTTADPARAYRFPSLAIPAGSRLAAMVDSFADHEVPAKIEAASRIILRNVEKGRKTLVWSNFPGNLLDLEQQLAALEPALAYGGIPSVEDARPGVRTREGELTRFRNDDDCKVLLANPAALSEGVSLHHWCNDAIYIDRTFNAGQYLQSIDRIHRLGLKDGVKTRISLLTSVGSIDERIHRRVERKIQGLSAMLADERLVQMSLPDDDDEFGFVDDTLDIAEVLAHLAGAPLGDDDEPH